MKRSFLTSLMILFTAFILSMGVALAEPYEQPYVRTTALYLGQTLVTATGDEINKAADASARVQELTVSGAITAGVQSVELNHVTVVVAATVADLTAHPGILIIKDTSATGVVEHTVTLTAGTFNGTNTIATFNALNEALIIYVDSAGNGTVVENVGAVALSGP